MGVCEMCSHTALVINNVFASLSIAISAAGIIFVAVYWNKSIIALSQRYYLMSIMIASFILSVSRLFSWFQAQDGFQGVALCYVDSILMIVPSVVLISVLMAKEYRVYLVYKDSLVLKKSKNIDKWLYLFVFIVCFIAFILTLTWKIVSVPTTAGEKTFQGKEIFVGPCEPSPTANQTASMVLGIFCILYLFFTVGALFFVAYKTKNVPGIASESRVIFLIVATCTPILIIGFSLYIYFYFQTLHKNIEFGWGEAILTITITLTVAENVVLLAFRKAKWLSWSKEEIHAHFFKEVQKRSSLYSGETESLLSKRNLSESPPSLCPPESPPSLCPPSTINDSEYTQGTMDLQ